MIDVDRVFEDFKCHGMLQYYNIEGRMQNVKYF